MLNLETLLRIPDIDPSNGYSFSPEGRLAFSWNKSGRWEIYELVLDQPQEISQVSNGPGGKFAPRYSPDGKYLAWAVDFNGSENFHIVILDRTTGIVRDIMLEIDFAVQPIFAWSPDSQQIAYLADKTGNFDLYACNLDGSNDRLIFSAGGPASFVRWSPAGAHIVLTAEKEWQTDGTFIVPLDDSPATRIGGDENPIDAWQPAWSPDGTRVVFTSNTSGWAQVGVYHLDDGHIEWLTSDASDKFNPNWSPDREHLAWVRSNGATAWVEIRSGDGTPRPVRTEAGFANWPMFTPDSRSILFVYENPRCPLSLWRASLDDGQAVQLIDPMPAEFKATEMVQPEAITYPSLDGTLIPAMLYKPRNAGPHSPAVVLIHGGPSFHLAFYWHPFITHLASRGWTVIAPNYRGSTGYGRAWITSSRYEMGRLDSDDCAAAALYLAREKLADPKRIAVTGRSHGGYLTMTCLTRNPELFAVGSAVVPFLNWFTSHENSREDLQFWDILNMGDPKEYHDLWYERSPSFFLDRVRAPVQFISGEFDPRCPPSESVEAHKKLKENGVECELLIYKDEGHAFLKIENVIDSEVKCAEFLAKVLEGKGHT